mgnify:CR=1 FL=1
MPILRKSILGFASEGEAIEASAILGEMPGFEDVPLVVLEDKGEWFLESYDGGSLAEAWASALAGAGVRAVTQSVAAVPETDWVAETQRLLPPVRAGRFAVHGSHDRARIFSRWAIEIDAGRAFGTAHHGTTRGCLLAIERLIAVRQPRSLLDLGTGSGVLAIAAAKVCSHRAKIVAADIDPIAIAVARENFRKNGVAECVSLYVGDGMTPALAYIRSPFGAVVANILAKPLLKLAPRLRELTARGGLLILSGLLDSQAREVLARYRATGFYLLERRDLEGWTTLALRRRL